VKAEALRPRATARRPLSAATRRVHEVHLTPALRETLTLWRVDSKHVEPSDYVIVTATGRKHNPSNLRREEFQEAQESSNLGTLSVV
jgi:hypothetical protein